MTDLMIFQRVKAAVVSCGANIGGGLTKKAGLSLLEYPRFTVKNNILI
jgi:hypothetical protein